MARGKLKLLHVGADIILLVLVLMGSALYYKLGKPFKRGFYCDDETIQYPYKEDTVSNAMLYIIAVVIPFVVIVLAEIIVFKFFKTNNYETSFCSDLMTKVYKVTIAFLFGAAVTNFTVDVTKYSVGRLRPHFLAVCQPDTSKFNCSEGYITEDVCSGADKHKIERARVSFPSGHAALTFYGMIFIMMFIRSRLQWRSPIILKSFLLAGCLLVAVYVSVSRIFDYKHHPGDVAVGAAFGIVVALVFSIRVADLDFISKASWDTSLSSPILQPRLVNNTDSTDTNISVIR